MEGPFEGEAATSPPDHLKRQRLCSARVATEMLLFICSFTAWLARFLGRHSQASRGTPASDFSTACSED